MWINLWRKSIPLERSRMVKILIAGEGGQGIQAVAKIITLAAQQVGLKTSYIPSFGVEQRGGVSLAYIQISPEEIPYPRFEKADIVVAFCNRAIKIIKSYMTDNTLFIYDNSAIYDEFLAPIKDGIKKFINIPAQSIAKEKYSTKILNMVFLGALAAKIEKIDEKNIDESVLAVLGTKFKDEATKKMNLDAVHEGLNLAKNFDQNVSELKGIEVKEIQQEFSDDKKTWTRFPEHCKGCALCIVRCPVHALKFSEDLGFLGNPMPIVDINKCIGCGMCEKTCPEGAIKVDKK